MPSEETIHRCLEKSYNFCIQKRIAHFIECFKDKKRNGEQMLSKKARNLKPSPTLAIAAKAKELASKGHQVIALSVGEPDWDTFPAVKESGIHAIQSGQTKYAPSNGTPELRAAIALKTKNLLGIDYSPNEVTATAGAKFVIYSALQMLLDPGDEVLIPAPYWVSYPTMVELCDGVPVIVPTDERSGFKATSQHLEEKITSKTKLLLLNSPNNPTGQVYSRAEIEDIVGFMRRNKNLLVISDDIYNQLLFTNEKVAPHILHVAPDLKDRLIIINGASKTYSMTGWRMGWALGNEGLIKAMSNYQSQTVSCASPFTQMATLTALQTNDSELSGHIKELISRRNIFVEGIKSAPGWRAGVPQGAFYVWADVRGLMGKTCQGKILNSCADVAQALLEDQKVALVPGGDSGLKGYVRLSFALHERDIREAVKRIHQFSASLK